MKVYGPYTRKKDGRKHVVLYYEDGTQRTLSYPRWLMQQHLGRELLPEETVDHINNDKTDDRIENLQILSLVDNVLKYHRSVGENHNLVGKYTCPSCGADFERLERIVRAFQEKRGLAGPFCSISCSKRQPKPSELKGNIQ